LPAIAAPTALKSANLGARASAQCRLPANGVAMLPNRAFANLAARRWRGGGSITTGGSAPHLLEADGELLHVCNFVRIDHNG